MMGDDLYASEEFQAFFKTSARSLILKANAPHFTIIAVSDNYLALTHKQRHELLNQNLFEVFPGSQSDPLEKHSVFSSFQRVTQTKAPDVLPTFSYEIYVPEAGKMVTEYWSNLNEPIIDKKGDVAYIINTTANITAKMVNQQALEEATIKAQMLEHERALNEELAATNEELNITKAQLEDLVNHLEARVAERAATVIEREEKLKQAIEAGKMATWSVDPVTFKVTMSDYIREIIGLPEHTDITVEAVKQAIEPEYKNTVANALSNAILHHQPTNIEYPVRNYKTGEIKWIKAIGKVFLDRDGNIREYEGLLIDITDQKRDEQRKNDFIAIVSHELKTPLTSMGGYLQMLQLSVSNTADGFASSLTVKAEKQVKRMTKLVNNFLNISRLEAGKILMDKHRFNMADLVKEAEEEIIDTVNSHRFVFEPVEDTFVIADKDKIGQVINNFLSNAVKYSAPGSTIHLACITTAKGKTQVSVRDEGIGIAPQDTGRIFERYYRVKDKNAITVSGFGIGLYLCSEIIHRHSGSIWVNSETGKGSTFYFSLPVDN